MPAAMYWPIPSPDRTASNVLWDAIDTTRDRITRRSVSIILSDDTDADRCRATVRLTAKDDPETIDELRSMFAATVADALTALDAVTDDDLDRTMPASADITLAPEIDAPRALNTLADAAILDVHAIDAALLDVMLADAATEDADIIDELRSKVALPTPSSARGAEARGENPSIVTSYARAALPAAIAASIGAMSSVVQKSA